MNGQELKERRLKTGIIRRGFANLLGVTEERLYKWESGKTKIPPDIEERVETIENRFNKRLKSE